MTMDSVERGRRLKELREAAGLLQRQVGAAFDIDKAAVSEWERGKSNPDRKKLVQLDELYEANGEVLELFDVRRVDEIDLLRADVDRLNGEVSRLDASNVDLEATVRELAALVRERLRAAADDGRSAPGADEANGLEPPAGEAGPQAT